MGDVEAQRRITRRVERRPGVAGFRQGAQLEDIVLQLAEQVGCTHGNLYVHFKDKEALFDALVEESFEQFAGTPPFQPKKENG